MPKWMFDGGSWFEYDNDNFFKEGELVGDVLVFFFNLSRFQNIWIVDN